MSESTNIKDLWREFNQIKLSVRKKLLKKPNFHEAIVCCRRLADSMEEGEYFDQSALCHREIATLCAKIGNPFMERRHLLKAAKLYYSAQIMILRTNSKCSAEFDKLMEQCYLEVILGLLRSETSSNYFSIVGLTLYELASQMLSLKEPFKAFIYFKRASRFVPSDLTIQVQIIECLCDLVLTIGKEHSAEVLSEVDSAWMALPRKEGIHERMLSLEARIILLHLKQRKTEVSISSKINFLSTYDGNWRDSARRSVTTKKEFEMFSRFICFITKNDLVEASQMYTVELANLLDSKGKTICVELIESMNFSQTENSEFDAIFELELSELEKREKLFEVLNNFQNSRI